MKSALSDRHIPSPDSVQVERKHNPQVRPLIQGGLNLFHYLHLSTMLVLVGLGLADEMDITVKGLEAVKSAERVYLEAYTSILLVDKEKLVCV